MLLQDTKAALYKNGIHAQMFELVELHRNNSILHHLLELTVEVSLLDKDDLGRIQWIRSFGLVKRLLDNWNKLAILVSG